MIQQFHIWVFTWKNPKTLIQKDTGPDVLGSTIYNSQDMEATQVSINRWVDKEDVRCIQILYTYIYLNI